MGRVVLFDSYGGPEVLRLAEVAPPQPAAGQVLVAVKVAGVQPYDVKMRRGDLAALQPVEFPAMLGNEYAGTVAALGDGVTGFAIGDEVVGSTARAGYADFLLAAADQVVAKPEGLALLDAGALVAAGQTASGALAELGVGAGDTLLVHAAAGSVGTVAVQLARAAGATVIGTASEANHDYLRGLGAIPVAYGPGLVDRVRALAPRGVTVALDAVGGDALAASAALVADPHRIGTIADPMGAKRHGARPVMAPRSPRRLATVLARAAAGELTMPVRTYPLEQVVQAHRAVESGHGRGKVVLLL
jgi:NADPH:quinone reductase-like Zn-dependent oxidoreductase